MDKGKVICKDPTISKGSKGQMFALRLVSVLFIAAGVFLYFVSIEASFTV